ncbi:oligosaccharide flippase family protein [Flavobacterium sp. LMO8]|uniref:oligosaccharide flippase family protein n=1 Tax=Flavobacterium sp. LMO8 TaxID=2654244 RepID=UPI001290E10E|nr:oligosaccharide flippase family protein [Flavobacterium sp. LMO8]MQP24727.1 oligosaccharide flippase family protein [Flavobacterium sp. LMO8]
MKKTSRSSNTVQAFWVASGSLSSIALAIVSAAILSRYFSKSDYGTYKQVVYVYSSLLVLFSAGLPRVYSYFLPRYTHEEGLSIVKKVSKMLLVSGLLFCTFLYFLSEPISMVMHNPSLAYPLRVFSPIPLFLLPTLGLEGIFATYRKTMYLAIYNTISRFLMLLFIVVPVVFFKGSLTEALYGWVFISVLTFFLALYFKTIPFRSLVAKPTNLTYSQLFEFSLPLVTASLWGIAIKAADPFFISHYFGSSVFAEYSNGFIELPFVSMITSSTSVVLLPVFSKMIQDGNTVDSLLATWTSVLQKSALLIYPLVVFFIFYAESIMVLLYSEKYAASGVYFQINMVLNFFNIIIFAPLFLAMGKTKLYSHLHLIFALILWGSDFIVIQLFYTPEAIAINTTFFQVVKIFLFMYWSARFLNVSFYRFFPFLVLLKVLFLSLFVVGILKAISLCNILPNWLFIQLILNFVLYIILLLGISPFLGLSYKEIIKPLLKKISK